MKTKKRRLLILFLVLTALLAMSVCLSSCFLLDLWETEEDNGITITWYKTPSSSPSTITVYENELSNVSFGAFARQGYTFLGLFDQQNGGSKIVDENGKLTIVLSHDITLYAQWEGQPCSIVLDIDEELLPGEELTREIAYGDALTSLPVPEKVGYSFIGWYYVTGSEKVFCTDANGKVLNSMREFDSGNYYFVNDTVTLLPEFGDKVLTVSFDFCNSNYPGVTEKVVYNNKIDESQYPELIDESDADPCKEIIGWSTVNFELRPCNEPIVEDITLYAIWKDYKVYNFYSSTAGDKIYASVKVHRGEDVEPITMPSNIPGSELDGWYTSTTLSGSPVEKLTYETPFTANLYPRIVKATYTISFETFGGTIIPDQYYTIDDDTITLPTAADVTRIYSTFVGWYTSASYSGSPVTTVKSGSYGHKTFYAKYKGQDMRVNLDAGSGTISSSYAMLEYGASFTLSVPNYSGYAFTGWFDADGNKVTDDKGKGLAIWLQTDNSTLYAKYSKKYYVTVTTNKSGFTASGIRDYYLDGDSVSLSVSSHTGYTFDGWYSGTEFISKSSSYSTKINGANISLSISWSPNQYTAVSLNANGGSVSSSSRTLTYNQQYNLPVPTRSGYYFLGWYNGSSRMTDKNGNSVSAWTTTEVSSLTAKWFYKTATFEDSERKKVTDTDTVTKNPYDTFTFSSLFGYSLSELKSMGFTKISVTATLTMREIDDGYQEMFINTSRSYDSSLWRKTDIEHGSGKKNTSVGDHTFWFDINLSNCAEQLYVLYGAHGSLDDDWYKEKIKLVITLS